MKLINTVQTSIDSVNTAFAASCSLYLVIKSNHHSRTAGACGDPVAAEALAAVRPDYVLWFAPERWSAEGRLVGAATAAGDIWGFGLLLAYMLRFSLPLVQDGPHVRSTSCFMRPFKKYILPIHAHFVSAAFLQDPSRFVCTTCVSMVLCRTLVV